MYPYLTERNKREYLIIDAATMIELAEIRSITTYVKWSQHYTPLWSVQIKFKTGDPMHWAPSGYENVQYYKDREKIVNKMAQDIIRLIQTPIFHNLPHGRLGIYSRVLIYGKDETYNCIFEVEELDQIIDKDNVCKSKVRYLGVTSDVGKILSISQQFSLLLEMPAWVATDSISWKQSDEAQLTHEVKEIRERAKARLNNL